MSKYIGIWILLWCVFKFIFHAISYDDTKIGALLYYVANGILNIGIFALIYSMIDKLNMRFYRIPRYKLKRLLKTVLIYSAWCLVVDVLIFSGIGARDTAFYTISDMGILGFGTLWAIFV